MTSKKKMILALGRAGDALRALPIAERVFMETGYAPAFAIAHDYRSLLDSVSYVQPVIYPGRFQELTQAMHLYAPHYDIIQCQVYGWNYGIPRPVGTSYIEDMFNLAGRVQGYRDGEYNHINLDVRYPDDEAEWVKLHEAGRQPDRPTILVNLSGISSPFPHAQRFFEWIVNTLVGKASIINLEAIKAKRIGDLLALYERSQLLITADSATLHLAGACPRLPVVALIAETPSRWHGSPPIGSQIARVRYSNWERWLYAIQLLAERAIERLNYPIRLVQAYQIQPKLSADTFRRNSVAMTTWNAANVLGSVDRFGYVPDGLDLPRVFQDGDRPMAYVKDIIEGAFVLCGGEHDWIMLCNNDTCLSLDMYPRVVEALKGGAQGLYGPRRDFGRIEEPLLPSQVVQGREYPGTDIFIFRPEWWAKVRDEYPDMVYGAEAFDHILRAMMQRDGFPKVNDLIFHEAHQSRWALPQNRSTLPSQRHNLKLANEWLAKNNQPQIRW